MQFYELKAAIQRRFNTMKEGNLYRVSVDKDMLWHTYLSSFPIGANPIFRERTEHDCSCCRHFIKSIGDIVEIKDGKISTLWDFTIGGYYQVVVDALNEYVKSCSIENVFLTAEKTAGTDKNFEQGEDGVITWEHFFLTIPQKFIAPKDSIGEKLSTNRSTFDVLRRGLSEITFESIDMTLELIEQNSLYRGEEHKEIVVTLKNLKKMFVACKTSTEQGILCWSLVSTQNFSVLRARNSVIGTLLVDLSNGVELDRAVASFEAKVAPINYKRPTALVTKSMLESAKKKLGELGLTNSLERRFAVLEDVSVNNVLFADRSAKARMNSIFDEIAATGTLKTKGKNFTNLAKVPIEESVNDVLPAITSVKAKVENRHIPNFVSLIAPADLTAKNLFKWPNPFSWSYNGEVTDSIKERVKAAGGSITGDLRCSLSWFNTDDLDLHMAEPNGHIYFGDKRSKFSKGSLDVDMNNSSLTTTPVENITYENRGSIPDGIYNLYVNQYTRRNTDNVGFTVEIEFDGVIHTFDYTKAVNNNVDVASIQVKDGKFTIIKSLPSTQASKTVWNIPTNTFQKVSVITLSPNFWNGKEIGNKHYFFLLENCLNDGKARGFFNEFLTPELTPHRKVFEIIGNKMKTEESQNQLSGLGFSSTNRNSLICEVTGSFTRTIEITF